MKEKMAPTAACGPQTWNRIGARQKMDKHTMLRKAAKDAGITRAQAEKFSTSFLEQLTMAIATEGHLNISHFGTFRVKRMAPKKRGDYLNDPSKEIQLQMGVDVRFVASDKMKDLIREKNPWTEQESSKPSSEN